MKRFFISADIEGITDVTTWDECEMGKEGYESARVQMTKEVAAACEAIIEAGHEVVVRDGHGDALNIIHEMLPRGTKLMRGWANHPGSMMAGINEKYDGALFIGYHAPAGSDKSPLAHTVELGIIRYAKINGKLASEFTFNKNYAAQFGVPAIFISGDKDICERAEEEVPGIVAVSVKEGKGDSTLNMHPLDSIDEIKKGVKLALEKNFDRAEAVSPIKAEIALGSHQLAKDAEKVPGVKRVNVDTVKFTVKTATEFNIIRERIMG